MAAAPVATAVPARPALAPARAAAAAPGAAVVAPEAVSLSRSAMFLLSSATRVAASLAERSRAIFSALALACTLPLDKVSLSGVPAVGFFSSTVACTLPVACRWSPSILLAGTPSASLRRNSLKSRLCATTVCVASVAGTAPASVEPGTSSTAPALRRLTLPPENASGLARSIATSIWSSDTVGGLLAEAMAPAVSPGRTVTCRESAEGAAFAAPVRGSDAGLADVVGGRAPAPRGEAGAGAMRGTEVAATAGRGATGDI